MKILIHYGEIGLKGKNRPLFEKQLVENIKHSLKCYAKREQGRIIIETENSQFQDILNKIFGIEWFAVCREIENDIDMLKDESIKEIKEEKTFKIDSSRSYKAYPLTSMEINAQVGESVINACKIKVSLHNPEKTIFLEIDKDKAYVFSKKYRGIGGLPIGSSGRVLSLLSGGIDSPVSSIMMMKRGCVVDYLHIHSLRNVKEVEESKIYDIALILKKYSPHSKLYIAPYYPFETITKGRKYDLVIFRRFIMSLAQRLSEEINAQALVTGESVGQVASQTLENMSCIDAACTIPILRPLVGMNKEEIITLSKRFGTYEASIKPYKDCCSLIMKHPATKSNLKNLQAEELKYDLEKAKNECFESIEILKC